MRMSNWKKKLKKQLRSRKGWVSLAALILLVGLLANEATVGATSAPREAEAIGPRALEQIARTDQSRQVVLRRMFVCGEEQIVLGTMSRRELLDYAAKHPTLVPSIQPDGTAVFTENVEDLSPDCKQNAFFGLDANGNLSLFNGLPEERRVIRTFFQLNVEDVISSLPEEVWQQLNAGILVRDMDEFNSVLSTFSDYAKARTPSAS
jgi:forespore regulator of the sigma-K checkpoint